jgi:hypothetical protein
MTRAVRTVALFAAFMLVAASPTFATRGQPDQEVPFSAVSVGPSDDSYGPPPASCPGAAWQFFSSNGASRVTHLGLARVDVTHCSWFDSPTTGHFGPGTLTYTAANGDTLILRQWGTFTTVMTPDGFMGYSQVEWQIIGGTGHFDGADGSGQGTVVVDILANSSASTYWGTISYSASSRSGH